MHVITSTKVQLQPHIGWGAAARAHVPTLFRILETIGRTAPKKKYAVRDPLGKRFTESPISQAFYKKLMSGYMCTCARAHPIFRISGTAGRIALKITE